MIEKKMGNDKKNGIRKKIEDIIIDGNPFIILDTNNLDRDKSFAEIGLDSIDKIELMMMIEREFDISISNDLVGVIDTIDDAVNVVYRLKQGEWG